MNFSISSGGKILCYEFLRTSTKYILLIDKCRLQRLIVLYDDGKLFSQINSEKMWILATHLVECLPRIFAEERRKTHQG